MPSIWLPTLARSSREQPDGPDAVVLVLGEPGDERTADVADPDDDGIARVEAAPTRLGQEVAGDGTSRRQHRERQHAVEAEGEPGVAIGGEEVRRRDTRSIMASTVPLNSLKISSVRVASGATGTARCCGRRL